MLDRNRILHVDLSSGHVRKQGIPERLRHQYLGGEGINSRLLWEHFLSVDPHIDPLSPENILIAGAGPLVGTCFGVGSKMKFTYKSPAYNMFGDTSVGGQLGSQMRWAGYDHIVFTGKADHPVYPLILDDEIQIQDARHLTGMTVSEADAAIKRELGDEDVSIACAGPAAEQFVRFASVIVDRHRAGGRGGGGCVMASKNLKAIVVKGTLGVPVADPSALFAVADEFFERGKNFPKHQRYMRYGSLSVTRGNHPFGCNTYRNGQGHEIPEESFAKLDPYWYRDNLGVRATACSPGCIIGCTHWHRVNGDETESATALAGKWSVKPEFGGANPFGASCDCPDLVAVAHFNEMCNEYGMDVMEVGMGISFLMELWERGIVDKRDVAEWTGDDSLSLEWGNQEAMASIIDAIALQTNELGRILSRGVYRAAIEIGERKGVDALRYACYGKGGATHEGPVRVATMSMAVAVASIGAHHLKGVGLWPATSVAYFGRSDAADPMTGVLKGAGHAVGENLMGIANSLGICERMGTGQGDVLPLDLISRALEAATGLSVTPDDLFAAGERLVNVQKAFNSRLGLTRKDDTVCRRWLEDPQLDGSGKGARIGAFLEQAKDEYYERRGWDVPTGLQTRAKLAELDMLDVAGLLDSEGVLAKGADSGT